jgi:pimeloyl-ACP methyl ester carboxylesterase
MDHHVASSDQTRIHYTVDGAGPTALVFVHGWLGNVAWWSAQRDFFADRYTVVRIDLGGHGASDRTRTRWSAAQYADDLRAVADRVDARDLVLVGHSMAGAYVVEAAPAIARTRAIVLVDTLKDLDQLMTAAQAQQMFALYAADFRAAVTDVLPRYLFADATPAAVRERLQREFLAYDGQAAIARLEPLYAMDLRALARRVSVPVRAINADFTPTNAAANRAYFRDYDHVTIAGTGHYPMLERPDDFNRLLDGVLAPLTA